VWHVLMFVRCVPVALYHDHDVQFQQYYCRSNFVIRIEIEFGGRVGTIFLRLAESIVYSSVQNVVTA
jgi:hypothetical protein